MMAARKVKIRHDAETRLKIQVTQLLNRLKKNAMGKIKPELTVSQVRSIEILLRKRLPDISAVATLDPQSEQGKQILGWIGEEPEAEDGDGDDNPVPSAPIISLVPRKD